MRLSQQSHFRTMNYTSEATRSCPSHCKWHRSSTIKRCLQYLHSMISNLEASEFENSLGACNLYRYNRTLGFVNLNLKIVSIFSKERTYQALIRYILECVSTVWDHYLRMNMSKTEALERRTTRVCLWTCHHTLLPRLWANISNKEDSLPHNVFVKYQMAS